MLATVTMEKYWLQLRQLQFSSLCPSVYLHLLSRAEFLPATLLWNCYFPSALGKKQQQQHRGCLSCRPLLVTSSLTSVGPRPPVSDTTPLVWSVCVGTLEEYVCVRVRVRVWVAERTGQGRTDTSWSRPSAHERGASRTSSRGRII